MFTEKVGELAGKIWVALNEELKKYIKVRADKELYLGLGWLLREDKIDVTESDKEILVVLK